MDFAAACSNSLYLSKPPLQTTISKKDGPLPPSSCLGELDASQGQISSL
jgi:hypothetical protein